MINPQITGVHSGDCPHCGERMPLGALKKGYCGNCKKRLTPKEKCDGFTPVWNPDDLNGDTQNYCGYCGGTKQEHKA